MTRVTYATAGRRPEFTSKTLPVHVLRGLKIAATYCGGAQKINLCVLRLMTGEPTQTVAIIEHQLSPDVFTGDVTYRRSSVVNGVCVVAMASTIMESLRFQPPSGDRFTLIVTLKSDFAL